MHLRVILGFEVIDHYITRLRRRKVANLHATGAMAWRPTRFLPRLLMKTPWVMNDHTREDAIRLSK